MNIVVCPITNSNRAYRQFLQIGMPQKSEMMPFVSQSP